MQNISSNLVSSASPVYSAETTKKVASFSALTVSTVAGAILGGIPGATLGACTCLFDELAINGQIYSKHYLSQTLFWAHSTTLPTAELLKPSSKSTSSPSLLSKAVAIVSAAILPYFTEDLLDFCPKLDVPISSFLLASRITEEDKPPKESKPIDEASSSYFAPFSSFIRNPIGIPFLSHFSLEFTRGMIEQMFNYQIGAYTSGFFIAHLLNQENLSYSEVCEKASKILGLFLLKDSLNFGIKYFRTCKSESFHKKAYMGFIRKTFQPQNIQRLLVNPSSQLVLHSSPGHIHNVMRGLGSFTNILSDNITALWALYQLNKLNSTYTLLPYIFSLLTLNKFRTYISHKFTQIAKSSMLSKRKGIVKRFQYFKNLEEVFLRNAWSFSKSQASATLDDENKYAILESRYKAIDSYTEKMQVLLYNSLDALYFGSLYFFDKIDFSSIYNVKMALNHLLNYFSSSTNRRTEQKDIIVSNEEMFEFLEILNTPFKEEVHRTYTSDKNIVLNNYQLQLGDRTLTRIDHFEFQKGKRYALMGKSGTGKSSLLLDLKMGCTGPMKSQGEIQLASKELFFLNQNLFLPQNVPLIELAYFPDEFHLLSDEKKVEIETKVLELFEELDIDSTKDPQGINEQLSCKLHSINYKLSGGQSKKVGIIQAILSKPDLLILDETFTGLDMSSLYKVQEALKKHLPHTLIINVDHHAEEENSSKFYDEILELTEKGLRIKNKASIS